MEKFVRVKKQVESVFVFSVRIGSMWCGLVCSVACKEKETPKYHHQNNKDENDLNDDHSNERIQSVCGKTSEVITTRENWRASHCTRVLLLLPDYILTNIMKILCLTMWAPPTPMKITLPVVNLILFPRDRHPYPKYRVDYFSLFWVQLNQIPFVWKQILPPYTLTHIRSMCCWWKINVRLLK